MGPQSFGTGFGAISLAALAAAGGCASSSAPAVASGPLTPSLVMPSDALRFDDRTGSPAWLGDPRQWEYRRNDALMGGSAQTQGRWAWAVIRTRDWLRTTSGRPRDSSTTTIRTIDVRVVR